MPHSFHLVQSSFLLALFYFHLLPTETNIICKVHVYVKCTTATTSTTTICIATIFPRLDQKAKVHLSDSYMQLHTVFLLMFTTLFSIMLNYTLRYEIKQEFKLSTLRLIEDHSIKRTFMLRGHSYNTTNVKNMQDSFQNQKANKGI